MIPRLKIGNQHVAESMASLSRILCTGKGMISKLLLPLFEHVNDISEREVWLNSETLQTAASQASCPANPTRLSWVPSTEMRRGKWSSSSSSAEALCFEGRTRIIGLQGSARSIADQGKYITPSTALIQRYIQLARN